MFYSYYFSENKYIENIVWSILIKNAKHLFLESGIEIKATHLKEAVNVQVEKLINSGIEDLKPISYMTARRFLDRGVEKDVLVIVKQKSRGSSRHYCGGKALVLKIEALKKQREKS